MKKTSKICVALLLALAMAFALVATVACEQNPCANGHTLNAVAKKDANCKEAGYEAYWQCSVCQKLFSDEAGTREISSPTAIAKNNEHKYEWKSDETQHWQECSVCLTKTDKENHGTADSEGKCPTCGRSLASPQPVEQFVSAPFNGFVTQGSFVTDDFLALTFTDEQESGYAPLMLMVGFGDDVVFLFYKVEENKVTVYQPDSLVSSDTFGDLVGEGTIEGNKLSLSLEVVLLGQAEAKQIDFEAEMYKLHLKGAFAEDMPEFMWVAKDSLVATLALGDMGSNDTVKFNGTTYDDEAQLLDLKMPAQESTLEVINGVPTSHQHTVTYEHVANTWTHKVKCTDPSCPDSYEEIVKCTPEFNVCADCDHEYSTQDILDALFALVSTTSKEELSGTYRLTGVIKETGDVTYYEKGASYETTLTITVDGRDIDCFNMYGDSQEQLESLKVGDKITVSGRLVNYQGTKEFDSSCVLEEVVGGTVDPDPDVGYGTEEKPLSVSQALALAQKECADDDSVTQQEVVAKGKVQSTPKDNGTYLGQFYLVDESDPNAKILVYTISKTSGVADPVQNDIITIKGYIKNYKGYSDTATLEFASNGEVFVVMVQNERGNSTITIGAHDGATLSAIASTAKNGSEITFTVSPDGGKKIVAVKVNSVEISADGQGNYTFTLLGDAEITVETINEGEQEAQKLYSIHLFDDSDDTINDYLHTGSATKDNFTLNFYGFNKNSTYMTWSNVRCGHKKDAQTGDKAATITTAQVVAQRITKVVVTVDAIDSGKEQYINSFKLVVASDSDFTKDVEEVEVTMKVGINEFVVATPTADRYYKIVIDSDATGKNGCYQFSTVEFWGYAD